MIEVAGRSPDSFSEAVRSTIEALAESGERVHFFQVMEQRGATLEGKIKEFQVITKAAVE